MGAAPGAAPGAARRCPVGSRLGRVQECRQPGGGAVGSGAGAQGRCSECPGSWGRGLVYWDASGSSGLGWGCMVAPWVPGLRDRGRFIRVLGFLEGV